MSAHTTTAYIGLGSNMGDPDVNIVTAIELLDELEGCEVQTRSALYRSAPLGPVRQSDFVNAVVIIRSRLTPAELLHGLKGIERRLGRSPNGERWGPRPIDLDLLVFGDEVIEETELIVPHPGIAERNFVLLPLREIAPNLVIPRLGPLMELAVNEVEPRIERIE